jgi:hypothetical protein
MKEKTRKTATSGSASQSGESSPVIVPHSMSTTIPQPRTAGPSREPAQPARSVSSSHAASHSRTTRPPLLPKINIQLPTGRPRMPQTSQSQSGPARAAPTINPTMAGTAHEMEERHTTVMLNSPRGSVNGDDTDPGMLMGHLTRGLQEADNAAEEREVYSLASPKKDEEGDTPLRQQGQYTIPDSGRPRGMMPFITTRHPMPSTISSQYMSTYRPFDPATFKLEKLTDEIGGLREEIRNSSAETNNAIAALIGELCHERRSRSSTSSSSRGRLLGARHQPTGQYEAYEATEERIDEEEPEMIREPTRLMDTRIEESPREEQNRVEEFICQLQASGELSALVGLQ